MHLSLITLNDTHREKLVLYDFSTKIYWETRLAASDVFHMFTQSIKLLYSIIVQMSEKRVYQIDSKNEWFLLSLTFAAKFDLVFVLTFENGFS